MSVAKAQDRVNKAKAKVAHSQIVLGGANAKITAAKGNPTFLRMAMKEQAEAMAEHLKAQAELTAAKKELAKAKKAEEKKAAAADPAGHAQKKLTEANGAVIHWQAELGAANARLAAARGNPDLLKKATKEQTEAMTQLLKAQADLAAAKKQQEAAKAAQQQPQQQQQQQQPQIAPGGCLPPTGGGGGTFRPPRVKAGDLIRSEDWNAAMDEIVSLRREVEGIKQTLRAGK